MKFFHALNFEELYNYSKILKIPLNNVVMRNDNFSLSNGGYIINLDNKNSSGTHYTALFIKYPNAYYFDSYSVPPPNEIIRRCKIYNLYYSNDIIYQKLTSSICGYFCIYFLYFISNGQSFYNFLYDNLVPFNINKSESVVRKFFNNDIKNNNIF